MRHALRFGKLNGLVERLIPASVMVEHEQSDPPNSGAVRNAAPLILN